MEIILKPQKRVALVYQGDAFDRSAWSGTPRGLLEGLRAHNIHVEVIRALPPLSMDKEVLQALAARRLVARRLWSAGGPRHALHRAVTIEKEGTTYAKLCSAIANKKLRDRGPFDAVLQVGASLNLDHPRVAIYGDMTAAQAYGRPFFNWDDLPAGTVRRRLDLQKEVYARSWSVCMATPWAARSVEREFACPPSKIHAVGIGANHTATVSARQWTTPRFLFVGRDWVDKNGAAVVAAFELLRTQVPTARLDLVGNHPQVHAEGVRGHGFLSLAVPAERHVMQTLFANATTLVVPTTFEPAGIVYLEAAAHGIPSIGTREGGAVDVIGPGGLVVDPDSIEDIASAMQRMCEPVYSQKLGNIAQVRSAAFTWNGVADRILQTLDLRPDREGSWSLFTKDE